MLFLNRSFNRHRIFRSSVTMLHSHRNNQEQNSLPINSSVSLDYKSTRLQPKWRPQCDSHGTVLDKVQSLCPRGCCDIFAFSAALKRRCVQHWEKELQSAFHTCTRAKEGWRSRFRVVGCVGTRCPDTTPLGPLHLFCSKQKGISLYKGVPTWRNRVPRATYHNSEQLKQPIQPPKVVKSRDTLVYTICAPYWLVSSKASTACL